MSLGALLSLPVISINVMAVAIAKQLPPDGPGQAAAPGAEAPGGAPPEPEAAPGAAPGLLWFTAGQVGFVACLMMALTALLVWPFYAAVGFYEAAPPPLNCTNGTANATNATAPRLCARPRPPLGPADPESPPMPPPVDSAQRPRQPQDQGPPPPRGQGPGAGERPGPWGDGIWVKGPWGRWQWRQRPRLSLEVAVAVFYSLHLLLTVLPLLAAAALRRFLIARNLRQLLRARRVAYVPARSRLHLELWVAQRLTSLCLWAFAWSQGTELYNCVLRLLGARISVGSVVLGTVDFPELVTIGPHCTIGKSANLKCVSLGMLQVPHAPRAVLPGRHKTQAQTQPQT